VRSADAEEFASYFTEDAVWWNSPWQPVTGRTAICDTLRRGAKLMTALPWEIRHIVASDGVVLTERVDNFQVGGARVRVPCMGSKAFTVYSTPCEGLSLTDSAVSEPAIITLKVGERYFMASLALRVFDRAGNLIPRAPIWALVEFRNDVLKFESDNDRSFWAEAVGKGEALAYFRVGCTGDDTNLLEVRVPVVVHEGG
jgi:hypothetical protein